MTTSARSPMPGAPGEDHGREQGDEERGERRHGQRPAQLVELRAERELHHVGAGLGSGIFFSGSGITGWSVVKRTILEKSMRVSMRAGITVAESVLTAPGTTRA